MRGFESMGCGFLLLDGWDTFWLWANMYAFCIAFLISFYDSNAFKVFLAASDNGRYIDVREIWTKTAEKR